MKTSIIIYKTLACHDAPITHTLITDNGTAYDLNAVLNVLGLPSLAELVRREHPDHDKLDSCHVPYVPSWQNLADSLTRTYTMFVRITEETGDILPMRVCGKTGSRVTDGADALAVYAETKSSVRTSKAGVFHKNDPLVVRGIVKGFYEKESDCEIIPCSYVLYEGDKEELLRKLVVLSAVVHAISASEDIDSYSICVTETPIQAS